MALPISLGDLTKIYELAHEDGVHRREGIETWLTAVHQDLEALAEVWIQVLAGAEKRYEIDQMLHWEGIYKYRQVRMATRLLQFYIAAEKVLFDRGPREFSEKFVFRLGSLLVARDRARALIDQEPGGLGAAEAAAALEKAKKFYEEMQEDIAQLQVLITTYRGTRH